MALHIMPANELHETKPSCQCRPRYERHARRAAWKHNAAKPRSRASGTVTVVHHYPQTRIELDARRLHDLAATAARSPR